MVGNRAAPPTSTNRHLQPNRSEYRRNDPAWAMCSLGLPAGALSVSREIAHGRRTAIAVDDAKTWIDGCQECNVQATTPRSGLAHANDCTERREACRPANDGRASGGRSACPAAQPRPSWLPIADGLKLTTASSWLALPARRRLQLRRGEDLLRQERQCADVDGANSLGHPDFRADDHGTSSTIPTSSQAFPKLQWSRARTTLNSLRPSPTQSLSE